MAQPIEVEITPEGQIHALHADRPLPAGRALLFPLLEEEPSTAQLSEASLAEDWLSPEEDTAWAHLQPAK